MYYSFEFRCMFFSFTYEEFEKWFEDDFVETHSDEDISVQQKIDAAIYQHKGEFCTVKAGSWNLYNLVLKVTCSTS